MLEKELLVFAVLLLIIKYVWQNYRFYYLAWKIPKSAFEVSFSNIWKVLTGDNRTVFYMLNEANIDGLSKTWYGPLLFVTPTSPEDLKIVMNAKGCVDKPFFVIKSSRLEQGTLFGNIHSWQSHRKILNPFFGVQSLRNTVIPIFNTTTDVLMKNVATMEGKGEFNVFHYMTALTLETILKVMEYDVDIQSERGEKRDTFIHNLET